jgi:hypothetical protein
MQNELWSLPGADRSFLIICVRCFRIPSEKHWRGALYQLQRSFSGTQPLLMQIHLREESFWEKSQQLTAVLKDLGKAGFILVHKSNNPLSNAETIGSQSVPCCHKLVYINERHSSSPSVMSSSGTT